MAKVPHRCGDGYLRRSPSVVYLDDLGGESRICGKVLLLVTKVERRSRLASRLSTKAGQRFGTYPVRFG
jgi:hypothetical protein